MTLVCTDKNKINIVFESDAIKTYIMDRYKDQINT